jgi:hypothetical protein
MRRYDVVPGSWPDRPRSPPRRRRASTYLNPGEGRAQFEPRARRGAAGKCWRAIRRGLPRRPFDHYRRQWPALARDRAAPDGFDGSAAPRCASGTQACADGKADEAVTALEYAAGVACPAPCGSSAAYADGDGVDKNTLRAFNISAISRSRTPTIRQKHRRRRAAVGSAFVAPFGTSNLEGIPDTYVKPDAVRAHHSTIMPRPISQIPMPSIIWRGSIAKAPRGQAPRVRR